MTTKISRLIVYTLFGISLFLFLSGGGLVAAEEEQKENSAQSEEKKQREEQEEEKSEEEEEEIRSLREQRSQTLKYGIDSQIKELVSKLTTNKNERYNELLVEVYKDTSNPSLQKGIVQFFDKVENKQLYSPVKSSLVEEWEDLDIQTTVAMIKYTASFQDEKLSQLYLEMSDSPRGQVAGEAIRALGKAQGEKYTEELKKMYEESEDNRSRKSAILEAIGERRSEETVPLLSDIVLNEEAEAGLRWKACTALGKIGTDKALETLMDVMSENDPRLRQYAVKALGNFSDSDEIVDLLIEALKDNNWRVRKAAAVSLGELETEEAIDILQYKAEYDPDPHNVGRAAVRALGKIGTEKAYNFLREMYSDSGASMELRGTAIEVLVEHDITGSIDTIKKVMQQEWDKENSRLLDYTCKQLSRTEYKGLEPLFKRMLNHPKSINIPIYGLRGIRRNTFSGLSEEVKKIKGKETADSIRSLAASVLEEL